MKSFEERFVQMIKMVIKKGSDYSEPRFVLKWCITYRTVAVGCWCHRTATVRTCYGRHTCLLLHLWLERLSLLLHLWLERLSLLLHLWLESLLLLCVKFSLSSI